MTQKEKDSVKEIISAIKKDCKTLENIYLQSKNINIRWVKQSLEETIKNINNLIN